MTATNLHHEGGGGRVATFMLTALPAAKGRAIYADIWCVAVRPLLWQGALQPLRSVVEASRWLLQRRTEHSVAPAHHPVHAVHGASLFPPLSVCCL